MTDELAEKLNHFQPIVTDSCAEQQRRTDAISLLVTKYFPHRNFLTVASQQAGVKVEELDEEWKEWADVQKEKFKHYQRQLIDEISKSQVKLEEVDDYLTTLNALLEGTRVMLDQDGLDDIQTMLSLVRASESLNKAKLWLRYAKEWRSKFITNVDDRTARDRMNDFIRNLIDISGHNIFPRPPIRSVEETDKLMQAFLELYDFKYSLTTEQVRKFVVGRKEVDDYTYETNILDSLITKAKRIGLDRHDATQIRMIFDLIKKNQSLEADMLDKYITAVECYGLFHGLTETTIKGFQEKLLPALLRGDTQVQVLLRGGNIWSMGPENMGIGDFICHCYVTEITPYNLNDLLLSIREVPTTDSARFEQNRLDALTLMPVFGALRDFIHDQRPEVNDVIQEMIDYYQTGDKSRLEFLLLKTGGYLAAIDRQVLIFNRDNYEREVEERVSGKKGKVKAIDVLKRLAENTKPVADKPPVTFDQVLNDQMNALMQSRTIRGVSRELLGQTYDYVNGRLIELIRHDEVGLEPGMVMALAWLERQGFDVLQNMTYEDQVCAFKQKWFHSILQFQELTASLNDYNQEEFQRFINQVIQSQDYREAYKLISRRVLKNLNDLARKYNAEGKTDRIGALWSGNSAHELIGLTDLKPASTEYGKRHREERLRPESKRLERD